MIPTFDGKITTYEQWVAEFASLTGHTLKIGNKVFAEAYGKEPGSDIFWIAKESEGKEDLVTVTSYQAPTLESTLSTLMFEQAE